MGWRCGSRVRRIVIGKHTSDSIQSVRGDRRSGIGEGRGRGLWIVHH